VEPRVQLAPTVPTAVFDDAKLTVPDGILDVELRSETVAVQVEVWPTEMRLGAQTTSVDVLSLTGATTVIATEMPELVL